MAVIIVVLFACSAEPVPAPVDRLVRASMALRGVRPSVPEVRRVRADPTALDGIARGWLADPRVGETVRDLHAEQLLVRIDTRPHPPAIGALAGYGDDRIAASLDEAPLRLIERIVAAGRPYTEVVTTPTTMADPIVAAAYGVPYDPAGPEWQEARWSDARPAAGILADTTLWQRFMSADTNFHRSRGALVLDTLLCESVDAAGVAVVDPIVAEDAIRTDAACVGCHEVLDPVSSAFWGFRRYIVPSEMLDAWADGCPDDQAFACYPLGMWDADLVGVRVEHGLPAPGLDGVAVKDLAGLGEAIAGDPRFATCTARRFAGYLGQIDPDEVPAAEAQRFAEALVAAGWDARELLLAIALSDWLASRPPLTTRPEQLDRAIEDLTGWAWTSQPREAGWAPVRLATTDEFGLRTVMGGLDGWDTVRPEHRPTPTRELGWEWVAVEAASVAVDDGRLPAGGVVTGPTRVRDAIADLHLRILAEAADDSTLDATVALFDGALLRSQDPEHAWKVVIAAMLTDARWVSY